MTRRLNFITKSEVQDQIRLRSIIGRHNGSTTEVRSVVVARIHSVGSRRTSLRWQFIVLVRVCDIDQAS